MKALNFFAKCILAALPVVALCAFTILCPMCFMDREYPGWRHALKTSEGRLYDGKSFDTVILGDSGAKSSLVPEYIDGSCVNLALGGATPIEMYYVLSRYLEAHDAPKTAVVMFAPFHYWHIDNYETRTVYFRAIPAGDLFELYKNAYECRADSVVRNDFVADELEARLGLPSKYLPAIYAARFTGRYSENVKSFEETVDSYGYFGFGSGKECYDPSYETSYDDMVINGDAKLLTLYMQKLLNLCKDNGIHVILLQSAVNTATYENINEHYLASYRNHIKQLNMAFPDIECESELRVYGGQFFSDTSHLNATGAKKFTEEINERYFRQNEP